MRDPIPQPERDMGLRHLTAAPAVLSSEAPGMMDNYAVRRVVSRFFPNYDRVLADRLIAWLNDCGYAIVPRHAYSNPTPLKPSACGEGPATRATDRRAVQSVSRSGIA
jgi:hypothetical protein